MAAFRCPSRDDILAATIALLPRGRAWQTHETGPQPGHDVGYHPGGYSPTGFVTDSQPASVLRQFWSAVAGVYWFVTQRLCALRAEFWCATTTEMLPEWLVEYGLPNACEPFPDLCLKVAAIGGTRCEYYQLVAARAGWSITCLDRGGFCGSRAGKALAGRAKAGRTRSGYLAIVVDIDNSPSYTGTRARPAMAGRFRAGRRPSCGPSLSALECILSRVIHAEIFVTYEVA